MDVARKPADGVPTTIDDISDRWLAQWLGPGTELHRARTGEAFGLNAMTHRIDWRHPDGRVQSVVLKFANAVRTRRESNYLRAAPALSSFRTPSLHR